MSAEAQATFECFGARCTVLVSGGDAEAAVAAARERLLGFHERFTRFDAASELSRLNADPRETVPVSEDMARFASAAVAVAKLTGGLVDPTLLDELELGGYATDLGEPVPLAEALRDAPARRPGGPSPRARWREVAADPDGGTITRPPGLRLDSGGVVKGLAADLVAADLRGHDAVAVECAGDLRLAGAAGLARPVHVQSPFDGSILHEFSLADAGVATSGIGRRSWRGADGRPAHHLLDPATLRPAFTGVVQTTAVAPSALEAEARAKAALLAGPGQAERWLPHGGALVLDDGTLRVL